MITWIVKGVFLHKKTHISHTLNYVVINDGADPIATLFEQMDFSGMEYVRGEVSKIEKDCSYAIF